MRRRDNNTRVLQELLESDDELPYGYDEPLDFSAYQNDRRFEYTEQLDNIAFPWLENFTLTNDTPQSDTSTHSSNIDVENEELNIEARTLVKKGVLCKEDIFCLECVGELSSEILPWFVNFLVKKDLQSHLTFLKSCLVIDYLCDHRNYMKMNYNCQVKKYKYEFVIKNEYRLSEITNFMVNVH